MAILYTLVARVTKRPSIGAIAAIVFGVSGAHFDTVTYVTALPHLLATFFMLASLLAIVTYAQDGERNPLGVLGVRSRSSRWPSSRMKAPSSTRR